MKINHLGIATKSIDEALRFWEDALGLENVHTETTSDDSPISKFIEKRGGGIHHIAVEIEDVEASLKILKNKGLRLIDESPRIGAEGCLVAFIHPSSANGVLLELVQSKKD